MQEQVPAASQLRTPQPGLPASTERLVPLLFGHAAFQHLNAACELGLHELLHESAGLTAAGIGERLALAERSVGILLLGTTALNLTQRVEERYYNSALIDDLFQTGSWTIFRDLVEFEAQIAYLSHADYVESLRRNTNAGLRWFSGSEPDLYRRLAHSPALLDVFYRCMNSWSRIANSILTNSDWFDGCHHVLDLGGGDGVNAVALARALPRLQITVVDLQGAVEIARQRAADAGLEERIRAVAADMFVDPYPSGCDCVLLANQVSIWAPADNLRLVRRAYEVLPERGKLVVFNEFINDTLDGPLYAALDNVYFATLPTPESRLYAPQECVAWARAAGFAEAAWFRGNTWTPHGAVVAVK